MTIAVLAFENRTGDPSLDFWHLAPEWLLAASLEAVGTIQIASEEGYALRQLHLKPEDPLALVQARKIGELLEARRVIWGTYERQGKAWLVTAHVLNVASAESLKDVSAASTDWFELRDQLIMKILPQLDLVPTTKERKRMRKRWTRSQESLEWVCRARALRDAQKPETETEAALRRAVRADPQCSFAHTELAVALWYEERLEDAEKEARMAVKWGSDQGWPHFMLGSVLTARQKYKEAEKSLQIADRLDPRDARIKAQMGVLYHQEGLEPKATQCYEQASQLDPLSPSLHARLGYCYVTEGKTEAGLRQLKEAERLGSEWDLDAEEFLAYAYGQLREVPSALAHLEKSIEVCKKRGLSTHQSEEYAQQLKARLTPVYVNVVRPKGFGEAEFAAFLQQKLDPADIALVADPLKSTPEMQRWANKLAAEATNDLQKAQLLFEALAHHPNPGFGGIRTAQQVFADWTTPHASFLCGEYAVIYVALSRACGLDSCFVLVDQDCYGRTVVHACACVFLGTKAMLVDPSYFWLGVPHQKFTPLDDGEATAAWLSEQRNLKQRKIACELAPNLPMVRFNYILGLLATGDVQSAERELPEALKLAPDGAYAMLVRGGLALGKGDTQACITWAKKAISINRTLSSCYLILGQAYTARREFSEALEACHAAIRLDPNDALVWGYLAFACGQKDQVSKEIDKLRNEVKADPNNLEAYSRLAALQAKRPDNALKNGREAVRAARKACELTNWENWQYLTCLADASAKAGDYEAAAKYNEQASKIPGIEEQTELQIQQWLSSYSAWHDSLMRTNFSNNSPPIDFVKREETIDLGILKQSAESGDAKAQAQLAGFLNDGSHGCPTNRVEAYKWAALAASQGNKDAHYLVQELELFMKPADLADAKASVQGFLDRRKSSAPSR